MPPSTHDKMSNRPTYIAQLLETGPDRGQSNAIANRDTPDVDEAISKRIRECYARANHPKANEHERRTALRMAAKHMTVHNVSQADVLANATTDEQRAAISGCGKVKVTCTNPEVTLKKQSWWMRICTAMSVYFDVQSFNTVSKIRKNGWWTVTFYGIAQNAKIAAEAYVVAFNSAFHLAQKIRGGKMDFCMGFSDGLCNSADAHLRESDLEAKQREAAAQKALANRDKFESEKRMLMDRFLEDHKRRRVTLRNQGLLPASSAASDADFDFDRDNDFQHELELLKASFDDDPETAWQTYWQLCDFRKNAKGIAEEWLKSEKVKLGKARRFTSKVRNLQVYNEGKVKGEEHDVKRKRLV